MSVTTRNSNVELLRIISIFVIVFSHVVGARRINISDYHTRLFVNSAMTMADFVLSVSENVSHD